MLPGSISIMRMEERGIEKEAKCLGRIEDTQASSNGTKLANLDR